MKPQLNAPEGGSAGPSGKALNEPADCPLATYPVKLENVEVWVEVGGLG